MSSAALPTPASSAIPSSAAAPSAPVSGGDTPPLLEIDGARATLRLNRPSQHNRIDPDDVAVMHAHLDAALARPEVRALVFAGSGVRTFSSGYTLNAILDRVADRSFETLLDRIESLPLPTVATLHGGVYGGSTDLALCCDLRVGVPASRMFMPAVRLGLHYYPSGLRRFVTRLGLSSATKLFLTGETLDADEMLRIGFLTDLVPAEALGDTVTRYVNAFALADRHTLAMTKRSLTELAGGRADPVMLERRHLDSLASPVLRERLARRLEH
ncbi:MAG: enoyl-CoA hydratase/isomerase family protein [Burkholderiaceae bacterium]